MTREQQMRSENRQFALRHARQCIVSARRYRQFCATHEGMQAKSDEPYWHCMTLAAKFRRLVVAQ